MQQDEGWEMPRKRGDRRKDNNNATRAAESHAKDQEALLRKAVDMSARLLSEGNLPLPKLVDKQTLCIMLYSTGSGELGYKYEVTQTPGAPNENDVQELRNKCGVSRSKGTTCAEERILCTNLNVRFLFSVAYSPNVGIKAACNKGCSDILNEHGIKDIYLEVITKLGGAKKNQW